MESLKIVKGILILALSMMPVALPVPGFAQDKDNDGSVKQDVKDAGHSTKKATKKTGHVVKKDTKKSVNKGAEKTGEAADKVQDKTRPQ
jgi:hypothetical protein